VYETCYFNQIQKFLGQKNDKKAKMVMKQLANCLRKMSANNKQSREFLTPQQIEALGPVMKTCLDFVTEMKAATTLALGKSKKAF